MKIRIWPVNLAVTVTKLDLFTGQFEGTLKARTEQLAQAILRDSDTLYPMVPIDTEALRSTGRVEKSAGGWAVVYGGLASDGTYVDYANQVHDDLRLRRYKRSGSGPKFVEVHYLKRTEEEPVNLNMILQRLASSILA